MKFALEGEMREHMINILKEKLSKDRFLILESQNVGDIIICRQGSNPAIFFLELKLFTIEKSRIGIGAPQGRGFQPEIIKKQPDYLSKHLGWILCDGRLEEPRYIFTDTNTISKHIMGEKIGAKQNNIRPIIFGKLVNLSENELIEKIKIFIET